MENILIDMLRADLQGFPDSPLPTGYSMRLYRPGDADLWVDIVDEADEFLTVTQETFDKEFGYDLPAMGDRCYFLVDSSGREIGTTTAWYAPNYKGDGVCYGRVHWVAIRPEAQGRGLCKPMLTVIMKRLAQSHDRGVLGTSSRRIPALKCYLDFGFVPDMTSDRAFEGWSQVCSVMKHPNLDVVPELRALDEQDRAGT